MCLQYVQGVAGAPRARAPVGGLVPTSPATVGVRDLRPSLPPGPSCWGFADLTDLSQRSHFWFRWFLRTVFLLSAAWIRSLVLSLGYSVC